MLAVVCALLLFASGPAGAVAAELNPTQVTEHLEKAERLQGNGFEDEARKFVQEVVQNSKAAIPKTLRSPEQRLGWWREALGTIGPPARSVLEVVVVLLGLMVVVLLVATAIKALFLRLCPSISLDGFTGSGDATVAPLLGAALSEALERMSDDTSGRKLTWASGTEAKFELPAAITEAVPPAGLLVGLVQMLDKLLYRKQCVVTGTVHPPHQHRGAGVTLVVSDRSGRESEQVTVWESEFMLKEAGEAATEAVRYERLILPVAIWLGYRPMLRRGFNPLPPFELNRRPVPPLGVQSWRSYALFALGELVPDAAKQRLLYERALDLDEGNVGARLNLASLLLQRPAGQVTPDGEKKQVEDGSSESWRERLKRAGADLEVVNGSRFALGQPIWFRGRYMEAIRCLYLAQAAGASEGRRAKHAEAARKALAELERARDDLERAKTPQTWASLAGARKPSTWARLQPLMDALHWPVLVLSASIELVETGAAQDLSQAHRGIGGKWLSASGEYNLACFWARNAAVTPEADEEKRRKHVKSSVEALRRAIVREEGMAAEARVDPAFDSIRDEPGFKAAVKPKPVAKKTVEPTRYVVTLDAGPKLTKLVSRRA